MLKCLVVLMILALGGCATAPENKVQVKITNTSPYPLVIRAGTSIFGVSLILMPGQSWSGVLDRRWVGSTATISVENYVPESR